MICRIEKNACADLAVPILAGQDQRGVSHLGLLIEIWPSLEQFAGNLLVIRWA